LNILLIILACFLCLFLCISVYFNIKFAKTIFRVEDSIELSLDVLDERYRSISEILDRPIFFDSLEIRQVISDITKARESVLYVAETLTSIEEKEEKNYDDQSKEEN